MAHKVLSCDMQELISAMKLAQQYSATYLDSDYRRSMLQAAHVLAKDSKNLLDSVDNARVSSGLMTATKSDYVKAEPYRVETSRDDSSRVDNNRSQSSGEQPVHLKTNETGCDLGKAEPTSTEHVRGDPVSDSDIVQVSETPETTLTSDSTDVQGCKDCDQDQRGDVAQSCANNNCDAQLPAAAVNSDCEQVRETDQNKLDREAEPPPKPRIKPAPPPKPPAPPGLLRNARTSVVKDSVSLGSAAGCAVPQTGNVERAESDS